MPGLFDFFLDTDNYEERKVANFSNGEVEVDTARVSDGRHPFETAVEHPDFNNHKWIIVEAYDTREEAAIGHNKWVKLMTGDEVPETLIDCQNSVISQLLPKDDLTFTRKRSN